MISFLLCICALVLGYFFYGRLVEKVFGPDPAKPTPAITKADGVDYIKLPGWRVFMIQFLNIAGTGPIFGAIMGAKFGPSAYLWIVFGCIFAGAVHDYLSGMLSLRNGGEGLPYLVGKYLGRGTKAVMMAFTVVMLLLVGAVFVYSPAIILGDIAGDGTTRSILIWVAVIFVYYVIATCMPIDKVIGKIYPLFAFALIFMALSLLVCLLIKWPTIPEFWDGLANRAPSLGVKGQTIFPCLFITVACGAISGFHATQSPLMARCMANEKNGRPIFYGSMITEGVIALIWAAVASYFFFDGGAEELGSSISASAPSVVTTVAKGWLGIAGGILAVLGVVAAPITSGDTAFRSARLIVSDAFKLPQKSIFSRLTISVPLFAVALVLLWFNIANEDGFNIIWRYFGLANQALSVFTLWALTVFLAKERKGYRYFITLIPACFMSMVCVNYLCTSHIGFGLPASHIPWISAAVFMICAIHFQTWHHRHKHEFLYYKSK